MLNTMVQSETGSDELLTILNDFKSFVEEKKTSTVLADLFSAAPMRQESGQKLEKWILQEN